MSNPFWKHLCWGLPTFQAFCSSASFTGVFSRLNISCCSSDPILVLVPCDWFPPLQQYLTDLRTFFSYFPSSLVDKHNSSTHSVLSFFLKTCFMSLSSEVYEVAITFLKIRFHKLDPGLQLRSHLCSLADKNYFTSLMYNGLSISFRIWVFGNCIKSDTASVRGFL